MFSSHQRRNYVLLLILFIVSWQVVHSSAVSVLDTPTGDDVVKPEDTPKEGDPVDKFEYKYGELCQKSEKSDACEGEKEQICFRNNEKVEDTLCDSENTKKLPAEKCAWCAWRCDGKECFDNAAPDSKCYPAIPAKERTVTCNNLNDKSKLPDETLCSKIDVKPLSKTTEIPAKCDYEYQLKKDGVCVATNVTASCAGTMEQECFDTKEKKSVLNSVCEDKNVERPPLQECAWCAWRCDGKECVDNAAPVDDKCYPAIPAKERTVTCNNLNDKSKLPDETLCSKIDVKPLSKTTEIPAKCDYEYQLKKDGVCVATNVTASCAGTMEQECFDTKEKKSVLNSECADNNVERPPLQACAWCEWQCDGAACPDTFPEESSITGCHDALTLNRKVACTNQVNPTAPAPTVCANETKPEATKTIPVDITTCEGGWLCERAPSTDGKNVTFEVCTDTHYSDCKVTCSSASQQRTVVCKPKEPSLHALDIPATQCKAAKPDRVRTCVSPAEINSVKFIDVATGEVTGTDLVVNKDYEVQWCSYDAEEANAYTAKLFLDTKNVTVPAILRKSQIVKPGAHTDFVTLRDIPANTEATITVIVTPADLLRPAVSFPVSVRVLGACSQGCQNNGKCNEATGQCECASPFSGTLCEKTPCHRNKCHNGICDASTDYKCKCNSGYFGVQCQHLGRCSDRSQQCQNEGYVEFVTSNAVLPRMLPNTGMAVQQDSPACRPFCSCRNNWMDTYCHVCGLQCIKHQGNARSDCSTCDCAPGYAGKRCECKQYFTRLGVSSLTVTPVPKKKPLGWGPALLTDLKNYFKLDFTIGSMEQEKMLFHGTVFHADDVQVLAVTVCGDQAFEKFKTKWEYFIENKDLLKADYVSLQQVNNYSLLQETEWRSPTTLPGESIDEARGILITIGIIGIIAGVGISAYVITKLKKGSKNQYIGVQMYNLQTNGDTLAGEDSDTFQ